MFEERLREARISAGLTQQRLGEAIGKDKIWVCKFEGGYCLPTNNDLQIICQVLHTTPKLLEFPVVATSKKRVATSTQRKSSTTTYKLTVALDRANYPKLTKSNLKKAGYSNLQQFIGMAYRHLEMQLLNNEK